MNTDKPETEDLQFLKKLIARSESGFQEYKKILFIWAGIIFFNGVVSQIFILVNLSVFIPGVWLPTVILGTLISRATVLKIRRKTGVNLVLAKYMAILWLCGIAAILCYAGIAGLKPEIGLKFTSALSFPVIGICTFGTATLLKSRTGYFAAVLFFLAAVPSALLTEWAMLIQAVVMGGGILLVGLTGNGQAESD